MNPGPPRHDQVRRFYDDHYYADDSEYADTGWHQRQVARRLGIRAGWRVLDIACGTGAWLAELERLGAKVHGIDISERAIEQASQRLPEADLRVGMAERLDYPDRHFDLVTCLGSLEHFLDQPAALVEMQRVIKPGGEVLLLVPNAGFLTRRLGLYAGTQQQAIKEDVRSIPDWLQLFREAGLEPCEQWRDLHVLSRHWICRGGKAGRVLRALQAAALPLWPIAWQYQVYFRCRSVRSR